MSYSNETLNDLRWKISEYQVWSSQQDIQLLHSSFSHLRKFYQTLVTNSWISYRLSKTMSHTCEIWTTFCSNFFKWKMAYIRIVDLDGLNKLCIQNFSIWDNPGFRKLVCRRQNLKITNLNHLTFSNGKLTKTTIVYIDEFNKLGIQNFSIWSHLEFIILKSMCSFFIWPKLIWSNLLKWDTKWPQMKKLWIPSLIISESSTIVT